MHGPGDWSAWKMVKGEQDESWTPVLLGTFCSLFLMVVVVASIVSVTITRKRKANSWSTRIENENYVPADRFHMDNVLEVEREMVTLGEKIGEGTFGLVYKGMFNHPEKVNKLVCIISTHNAIFDPLYLYA